MERWVGKVAVVTGASAGIGKAIVEKLVKAGVVTVGLARRVERLESIKESLKNEAGSFHGIQCDIREFGALIRPLAADKELHQATDARDWI